MPPPSLAEAEGVASFAAYLARGFGCSRVVALAAARPERPAFTWSELDPVEWQPHSPAQPIAANLAAGSVIHCRLGADDGPGWAALLAPLRGALDQAPAAVVERDAPEGAPVDLERLLIERGLNVAFVGRAPGGGATLAVLENTRRQPHWPAPSAFRVVAIMPVYNEEDVVAHTLRYLVEQDIAVYLLDNWSTDATVERARPFLGGGLLGIERFPPSGPSGTYDLRAILSRVEEIGAGLEADWLLLYDADERRRSPWPGVSLKDGLYYADRCGFTCIDFVTANFWPTDERFDPAEDVERQLTYFEFSDHPGHFHQRKAWKNSGRRVALAATAGHDVGFDGRLVYPFRFLLKHYPIRSQAHGTRKVLAERKARFNPQERSFGWHAQYDRLEPGHSFLRDPAELERFDEATFYERFLVERLSGLGLFAKPPSWATPLR